MYSVIHRDLTSFDSVSTNRIENIDQNRNIFKYLRFERQRGFEMWCSGIKQRIIRVIEYQDFEGIHLLHLQGNWIEHRDAQILFYVFISICNSLHVSSTSCSSSGETNFINKASAHISVTNIE